MGEVKAGNFGHVIAFLIPGFLIVWEVQNVSPTLSLWLHSSEVSGFLYSMIASLVVGLIVSALRAAFVDWFHHHTGVRQPDLDYAKLQTHKDSFEIVIENLYRYYQFYANVSVAVLIAYVIHMTRLGIWPWNEPAIAIVVLGSEAVLFWASRDSLQRCYKRLKQIL